MLPRYLKLGALLIGWPYTSSGGCGLQLKVMCSVLGTLMMRPSFFPTVAVLISCTCALGIEDSSNAMSSAKSKSFKILAG